MNNFSHFRTITVNRDLWCKRKVPIMGKGGEWERQVLHNQAANSSPVTYPKPKNLDVGSLYEYMYLSIYGRVKGGGFWLHNDSEVTSSLSTTSHDFGSSDRVKRVNPYVGMPRKQNGRTVQCTTRRSRNAYLC